ncbi:uncharacterized protein VP01_938g3 [Puccinia sorghi]|uniref:Uncharacterized protein n=1 Tax=Puccinia sorghi TaxID=27349 RepID=A0A0L6U8W7_9BASI|nr:uncharacterized protein VP01_938g3 [Puccinia sorghi]
MTQPISTAKASRSSQKCKVSQNGTPKNLMWPDPMGIMMLDLYIKDVNKGHKLDSGFQNVSHRNVSQELRKLLPKVEHVLDANKVKSKLSQGFKKEENVFLACKDARGLGWDKISCEASDAVWKKVLGLGNVCLLRLSITCCD